jgi:2,4-dienoyl-CoA reductase-like NADH-dependent reductase (Old Yellow Enzyme family)/thioredoxin reductase
MNFEALFTPIKIGQQIVKNRIAMAPMGTSLQDPIGNVTTEMVDYFEARAKGGTGLIISPFTAVDNNYRALTLALHSLEFIPGISKMAEAIKFYGTKFILQLSHFGGRIESSLINRQSIAPSAINSITYPEIPREMTVADIEETINLFIQSAMMARDAGCDGVELHGAHGYLINQFVSPYTNLRTDEYGGDFEGRMNFITKILSGIRLVCGNDFIIGYKFSAYEYLKGGVDDELAIKISRYMEKKGIDYLHVSALSTTISGMIDTDFQAVPTIYHPHGSLIPKAEMIKKNTLGVPIFGTGGISDPNIAESYLNDGKADMLVLGRALIADPEWVNKARNGDIIRQCIRCQACYKRVLKQQWVRCTLNPVTCSEARYTKFLKDKSPEPKKVIVIGAGPAGMEAAIRAKQRGHDVTLFESKKEVGGNLTYAAVPDFKLELKKLLETYKKELIKYKVNVKLNNMVKTFEDINTEKADVAIIAIGSELIIPAIDGIKNNNVMTVLEYLDNPKKITGGSVVVIGAGDVGGEVALDLTFRNKKVKLVDIISEKVMLADEIIPYRSGIYTKLKSKNIEILNEAKIEKIQRKNVIVAAKDGKERILEADHIIISVGFRCDSGLVNKLKHEFIKKVKEVYSIGDCTTPGRLYEAIHSGAETAWLI